jgi:hypothetical protein
MTAALLERPGPVDARTFEAETLALLNPPHVSRYGRVRWQDLDAPGPEHEYIIDGILSVGDKSIIGGASMSGKSFLAIHAGGCIALAATPGQRQLDFFGQKILRPGLVLYQAGEGSRGVKKRLRAWRQHHGVPADADVPFELLTAKVDLYTRGADTDGLIAEAAGISRERDMPVIVIFIDTLAVASGGADENSGKDMGQVMANIDLIQRATGAHVCLVHHFNAAGTKLRGHSSILANIDQVVQVVKNDLTKVRTAALAKQKDDDDSLTIRFELMQVEIGTRPDGKPITSCIVLPVGEKEEIRDTRRRALWVNDGTALFYRALLKALDDHGEAPPPGFDIPAEVDRVVHYDRVKAVYRAVAPDDDADPVKLAARLKKALQRARTFLANNGAIDSRNPYVWRTDRPVKGFAPPARAEPRNTADDEPPPYDTVPDRDDGLPF